MINRKLLSEAESSRILDAARNGEEGKRERSARLMRMPPETWEEIKRATSVLKALFPDKYVTVNSTVEFLLGVALEGFWKETAPTEVFVEEE